MDQGCPLSDIAYQFYNADLLEVTNRNNAEDCIGFVNDTTIIAEGANLQENFEKLVAAITSKVGGQEWATLHDCKFVLLGLTQESGNETQ